MSAFRETVKEPKCWCHSKSADTNHGEPSYDPLKNWWRGWDQQKFRKHDFNWGFGNAKGHLSSQAYVYHPPISWDESNLLFTHHSPSFPKVGLRIISSIYIAQLTLQP
jgi:hypothetical protein